MSIDQLLNVSLILMFICSCSVFIIFFFINKIEPNKLVDSCFGTNCKAPRCIGYNCKCKDTFGDNSEAGYCVGENCQAGNCFGTGCKAGDCYGYGCKPGICFDPLCPYETCPQTNKRCKDGNAKRIIDNYFLKNRGYFHSGTILNPKLCDPDITLYDNIIGRTDSLNLKKIHYNIPYLSSITQIDPKTVNIQTEPKIFKNINCELCRNDNDQTICHTYTPTNKNGKIIWQS